MGKNHERESVIYLFGYEERFRSARVLPITSERFTQNRVVGFFQAFGFLVKPRQVPFYNLFDAIVGFLFSNGPNKKLLAVGKEVIILRITYHSLKSTHSASRSA